MISFFTSDTSHYENVPFEVPEGWSWCTISDICSKIGSGSTPRGSNYTETGIPFFRSQNVYNDGLVYDDIKYIAEDIHQSMIGTEVLPKDLLLNITGGSLGRCAVVPSDFERGNVSQHVCILRSVQILPEYLHCFIISDYFSDTMILSGSGREGLPKYSLEAMMIPIPPLAEQSRIVTSIDQWISFIDSIESSTTDLLQSVQVAKSKVLDLAIHGKLVPQDASDEPASELLKRINPKAIASCDNPQYGKVPSSWVIATVGEIFTINPKTHVEDDTEAAFVPMTCVADGYSNTFEYECRKWGDIKKGFVHFQENDVAVAKISPCLENRKSVVFHDLPNGIGAGTTELNVFRCGEILPEYALFYFKSQMFIGSCAGTYNGVVGQQRVAKSFIQELPIGIPPYKEQLRIVSKVNDLFSQLDLIEKSLQA